MSNFGSVDRFTDGKHKCGPLGTRLIEKPVDPYAQYHNDPTKIEQKIFTKPEQPPMTQREYYHCEYLKEDLEDLREEPPYDMTIHDNPDALAWTRFFRETNPDCNVDDETMFCWFANAMMAMSDHTYRKYSQPTRKPLSVDKILTLSKCHTDRLNFARAIENEHGI